MVLALVLAELEAANEADSCHEATGDDGTHEKEDKRNREWHRAVREECQAKVAEDKSFCDEAEELEHYGGGRLALRRQVVPTVVSHSESTE